MSSANSHGGLEEHSRFETSDLFSEMFYNNMNTEYSDLSKYNQQCDRLILSAKNKNNIKEVCKKYLRYLEKYSTVWNDENPKYDVCILLNYWIYDKLAYYFGAHNADDINNAFSSFQLLLNYPMDSLNTISYPEKCKPNFELVNHHDWQKRKELYEYYVNYDVLHSMAKIYDDHCKYYKQIEDKISLYKYFEEQYKLDNNNCPDFYDKYKDKNPESVLPQLPCHAKILVQKEAERQSRPELGPGANIHGPGVSEPAVDIHGKESTPENSEIGKKVGHSVLGVAPVLLTVTALYRYTPIGSWVRKLGGYSPNNMNNTNGGEMEGFLDNTQGSGNMFFGNEENYISYQPM
ncbi:PIR protein [Plasmodium ovale]|uniref:PIR protein n=1 Tax=Plasmodium ovale TaxID=36330 RepID=A0A1D3JEI6_PLAOA|nr:PIR protein [Plasmodium ovale]